MASRGWAYDMLVDNPRRYILFTPVGQEVGPSLRLLTVPLAALIVLVLCVAWSLRVHPQPDNRRHVLVAVAAVVVALSTIPTAILAEAKLGGDVNQLAGPVWTLTLGCAVLLLLLRPSFRQLAAAAITCGVLLAGIDPLSQVIPGAPNLHDQQAAWPVIDPFLIAAVDRGEAVFDQSYPSLSVSPRAPAYPAGDIDDILAAGYTPRWFTDNLLTGRYALVHPFYTYAEYTISDKGRYDESVFWKYNLLLQMGYTPVQDPDSGVVYYRPTPRLKQLGWFAKCFGPYQARGAGIEVRVRGSGGLVCIDRGGLHLSQAPGPETVLDMTLDEGKGEATVRFATTPHILRVTLRAADDRPLSSGSNLIRAGSSVAPCLVHDGAHYTLTLRAVQGRSGVKCRMARAGPVLDVPAVTGESTAHVSVNLAATDSPTIVAVSRDERSVPFTLLNFTPSDVNSL